MIKRAYVLGVQDALVAGGVVKYANEEAAQADAGMLSNAMDQYPVDEAAMATEAVSPEATAQIATAVVQMAQEAGATAEEAKAKADIAANAAAELAKSGALKLAEGPADNNVIAGSEAGSVAAGEGVAKATDKNQELATAIPNTAERPDVFSAKPGQQADKDKGHIGVEAATAPAAAGVAKGSDKNQELATAIPNTAERPNVHGAPGEQEDEDKGHIGVEEKKSSIIDRLAAL